MSQSPLLEQDKSCSVNSNCGEDQVPTIIIEPSLSPNSKNDATSTSTNITEKSVVKKIDFSIESLLRIPYQECKNSNLYRSSNHSAIEFREKLNFLTFTNCFHLQNNKRRRGGNTSLSRDESEKVVEEESENHVDYDNNKYNSNDEEEEEESQCKSEGDEQSCDERVEIVKEMDMEIEQRRIANNNQEEEEEETETLSETEESTHKEFSWLYCSRFKPPKLPRSKKRGGCKRYGRGPRIPFAPHQITVLENAFKKSQYLSTDCIGRLAETLFLSENRVKIWFQNRRARFRRENSDQDISNMLLDKHITPADSSLNSPPKGKKSTSPTKNVSTNNNNSILLASPSHSNGNRKRLNNNSNNNNTMSCNNSNWSTTNVNSNNNSPNTLSFFPFQLERPQHNMFLNAETHFHNDKNNSTNNIIQHTSLTSPYSINSNNSSSRELSSEFIHSTISANAHFNRILYGTSVSAFAPIRR